MLDPFTPAELDSLLRCDTPLLIGVRHHSAALARAVPAILDASQPQRLFVELPTDFDHWLPWLGHKQLTAPIALAASSNEQSLCFYPFADFSPELAAIRWAFEHGVEVHPFDLPLDQRHVVEEESDEVDHDQPDSEEASPEVVGPDNRQREKSHQPHDGHGLLARLLARTQADDVGDLWERLVESPGQMASPDAIRRAGLLFGFALRKDDGEASPHDRARETFMRAQLERLGADRAVAVIGSYHAAALLPEPLLFRPLVSAAKRSRPNRKNEAKSAVSTALIPYTFEQLDDRSGYPAGVRDPAWRQRVWQADSVDALDSTVADTILQVCRELRAEGHPFHAADAKETLRMARDLAGLRGLAAPGRSELLESIQTCLTRGEVTGVGRAVAQAMQTVLVGQHRGELPADAPRSGLPVAVEALLSKLNLPGPSQLGEEPKRMRLDVLRSKLDRARAAVLQQLTLCNIPYGEFVAGDESGNRENLTQLWDVSWRHATAASLELHAALGATLKQATRGAIDRAAADDKESIESETLRLLRRLTLAANAGVGDIVNDVLRQLSGSFAAQAGLSEITAALHWLGRIRTGHVPALPIEAEDAYPPIVSHYEFPDEVSASPLLAAAIARLEGLVGSEKIEDAAALLDLILWHQQQAEDERSLDVGRLLHLLRTTERDGAALMQGAAVAARLLLDDLDHQRFGAIVSGWISSAATRDSRRALRDRLRGCILVAEPRLTSELEPLGPIEQVLAELADDEFLQRATALRGGFHVLPPNARDRMLRLLVDRYDDPLEAARPLDLSPELALHRARAEAAGRKAVESLLGESLLGELTPSSEEPSAPAPIPPAPNSPANENADTRPNGDDVLSDDAGANNAGSADAVISSPPTANGALPLPDRWKLILGAPPDQLQGDAGRVARTLDELYGLGRGEGAASGRARSDGGDRGGREAPFPTVREWDGELSELFAEEVREEILAQAAEQGRVAALLQLDPESVTPSVELLRDTLALQGGLPPDQAAKLRRIADRVIEDLTRELATRLRPALFGVTSARPTRRRTNRLDLPRTIRRNLHTAYSDEDGTWKIIPERLIFRSRAKRSIDWEIIFVVDVSGSMEASVIYSAIMASILAGLPAVDVHFLAFSTRVIDFTDHVTDPLELLLEVSVGGGTHIARGVRAAREKLRNPTRSIVCVISDFEEGGSVTELVAEVKAICSTGAKCLGLAALDNAGKPRYNRGVAQLVANAGMAVAALTPQELARWMGEQIQ